MDLKETGCEDGRWIELAQDRVQWRSLVLAVLNPRILLRELKLCVYAIVRVRGLYPIDQAKRERHLCSLHNRTKMGPRIQAK
jgi:hypothetical protein